MAFPGSLAPRTLIPLLATLLSLLAAPPVAHLAWAESEAELLEQLAQGDQEARRSALVELARAGHGSAAPQVARALRDEDEVVRELAERTLWAIWSRSGDPGTDSLLQHGAQLLARGHFEPSIVVFSQIIDRRPEFAEGWNKRATAWYQVGEYEQSLQDIDETLKRNPLHFGALSGAGLCLIELKRFDEALRYFDRALAINPNLEGIIELKRAVEERTRKPMA